ncbi:metallophosphoesterase family protein [Geotoga petraea]|nr:metallophosphoesterase [Geotoga petraea]
MKKLNILVIFLLIMVFSLSSNNILIKGSLDNSDNIFIQNSVMTVIIDSKDGDLISIHSNINKKNFLNNHDIIIQNHSVNEYIIEDIENGYKTIEKSDNFEVTTYYTLNNNFLNLKTEIKNISDQANLLKMNEILDYDGISHNYLSKSFLNENLFSIQVENTSMIYGSLNDEIKRMITNGNRIFSSPKFAKLNSKETFTFNRFFEVGKDIASLHKDYMDRKGIEYKTYTGNIHIKDAKDLEFININLKEKFFESILTRTYTDKKGNYTLYYPKKSNLYFEFENKNFSSDKFYELSTEVDLEPQINDFFYMPSLTEVTTNGITFNYRTLIPSKSIIHIFKDGEEVALIQNNYPKEYHQLKVMNLKPGTQYYYYVEIPETYGSEKILSPIKKIKTKPEKIEPFNFVVYGDSQIYNKRHELVVDTIYNNHGYPSFIVRVGDQVEKGHDEQMWSDHFEASYKLTGSVPVYFALGNHEYNDDLYYNALDLPDGGGKDNERYYSIDYLNVHFIFLDSNITETQPEFKSQLDWLENDLKNTDKNKFIFVSYHHPFWTQAQEYGEMEENYPQGHYNTKHWLPLFKEYGVDAVFNGHIHAYERYYKDGIQFVTTGGGGSKLNELHTAKPLPWKEFELLRHLNYVSVEIHDNKAVFTIYSVAYAPSKDTPEIYTPTNEIIDQFEVIK